MSHAKVSMRFWPAFAAAICLAVPAQAQVQEGKPLDLIGLDSEQRKALGPQYFAGKGNGGLSTEALPDVFGPGSVLRVGNIVMKVTNAGAVGNLFTTASSDPSGQWRGTSGTEYLSIIGLAVGAVNPRATDPNAIRRVSYLTEWRPRSLDPEDKIYRAYDGIVNGTRFFNDDADEDLTHIEREPKIDEDFLDGRDNDGDGLVDEDFAALGQEMFSFTMWDNTIQAINSTFNEKHVPIGLECRQTAWAYSIRGFQDFNIIQFDIYNRSGHQLDSMVVGFVVDMDAGPARESSYFQDDIDLPHYPQGTFPTRIGSGPREIPDTKRVQFPHSSDVDYLVPPSQPLCPSVDMRVNGFSVSDDNGDNGLTPGIASVLLIDMSPLDPTATANAPSKVGWRAFRSYTAGTPYGQGGRPNIDQERFELMTGVLGVDQETGFISRDLMPGEGKGDYIDWCSVGPWRNVPDGGMISVTIAFAIAEGTALVASGYLQDYDRYVNGFMTEADLMNKYKSLDNAFAAQLAFEGVHERREGMPVPDFHGREIKMRLPVGSPQQEVTEDCPGRDLRTVYVTDREYTWFDFDCNFCTGVWDLETRSGYFHHTWNAEAPPPNPNINVSAGYNFTDNPGRHVAPARDHSVVVAWDNLSEITPDPKSGCLDFRSYRVWKVADWTRPAGSVGPGEADWRLIGDYRLFEYQDSLGNSIDRNYSVNTDGTKNCPLVFIPNRYDSLNNREGMMVPICLDRGDLWDKQSGRIIKPDLSFDCVPDPDHPDSCQAVQGCIHYDTTPSGPTHSCPGPSLTITKRHYPVGRYQLVDTEVKNGFTYFYSVTASDSVCDLNVTTELAGRRSAVESEGVVPQISTKTGRNVWVVPNPYRGFARLSDRPSAWDLTPNASDPTGTHIDFMGLPGGTWTIKIFTISGDLVAVLNAADEVNGSLRSEARISVPASGGGTQEVTVPGFNRQQDTSNDGQARWNLISRNGQDIVSGVYLFTVESNEGTQRGKFVVIR